MARARWAILACFVVSGMISVLWVVRMPTIRDTLSLSASQVGSVLLATAAGSIASIPIVGRLAVALGSDVVLRVSLPLMALGALGLGLSTTYPILLAAAAVSGMFLGATDVTMNSQASLIERRSGEHVLSGMHAGWSVGSALGAGLAALTAAIGTSVAMTMAIGSAAVLLVWAPTFRAYLPDAARLSEPAHGARRARLPRVVLLIGAVMGLAYLIEGAVIGWSTLYLHDEFGLAAWLAAIGYLTFELAMVTGRLFGDPVRRRWGDRRSSVTGSSLVVVGIALVLVAPSAAVAVAGLAVIGLGQAVIVPVAFASAGLAAPALASLAIARVGGFGYAGVLAGPGAFGLVTQEFSMRAAFFCLLWLAVAMTIALRSGAVVTTREASTA